MTTRRDPNREHLRDILGRIDAGDEEASKEFIAIFLEPAIRPIVRRFARQLPRFSEDDLLQGVVAHFWEAPRARVLREAAAATDTAAFLKLCAKNHLRDAYRREHAERRDVRVLFAAADPGDTVDAEGSSNVIEERIADPGADALRVLLRNEQRAALSDCVEHLPPRQREVMRRHLSGRPNASIAEELRATKDLVRRHLSDAKRALLNCLRSTKPELFASESR